MLSIVTVGLSVVNRCSDIQQVSPYPRWTYERRDILAHGR